jgi:hypothetical protein
MTSRESGKPKALIRMEFGPFGAAKPIFSVEVHGEREIPRLTSGEGGIRTLLAKKFPSTMVKPNANQVNGTKLPKVLKLDFPINDGKSASSD